MERKRLIADTDTVLAENGKTGYSVFRAADGYLAELAESELKHFFAAAAGASLIDGSQDDEQSIWLGTAAEGKAAGLELPVFSGASDFAIRTYEARHYVCGASGYGLLYGVYELLNVYFDFQPLTVDETYFRTADRVLCKNIRIDETPDVEWRIVNFGQAAKPAADSAEYAPFRRLRLNHFDDALMKPGGYFCHNHLALIKPEEYAAEHPEWFSEGKFAGRQLCFSRDFDGLKEAVVAKMKAVILAHPDTGVFNFSQSDSAGWCECGACRACKAKYGTDAAVAVRFLNACAREIKAWLDAECGGRKVTFSMFAYQSTEDAPVVEANGRYVPADDSVVLDDNVTIFYAPAAADYYRDFYHPANAKYRELMAKWRVLSKQIHFWTYDLWGKSYLFPHYTFASRQGNYRFVKESGVSLYFNQGQYTQNTPTDWGRLKMYLDAKMSWDTSLDMNALTDDFLKKYYLDAAPAMRAFYDEYCAWHDFLLRNTELKGECFSHESFYPLYYPEVVLDWWQKQLDRARGLIERHKDRDPALWQKLADRIDVENLTVRYMKIRFYPARFTDGALWAEQEQFLSDAERLGVTCYSESRRIQYLREQWQISY